MGVKDEVLEHYEIILRMQMQGKPIDQGMDVASKQGVGPVDNLIGDLRLLADTLEEAHK